MEEEESDGESGSEEARKEGAIETTRRHPEGPPPPWMMENPFPKGLPPWRVKRQCTKWETSGSSWQRSGTASSAGPPSYEVLRLYSVTDDE